MDMTDTDLVLALALGFVGLVEIFVVPVVLSKSQVQSPDAKPESLKILVRYLRIVGVLTLLGSVAVMIFKPLSGS